ncbi:MAG: hypothetical protein EZS28_047808, partial [Streblomastix strix]
MGFFQIPTTLFLSFFLSSQSRSSLAQQSIESKKEQETDQDYEKRLNKEIQKQRKVEWDKRRKRGQAIREGESLEEFKARMVVNRKRAMERVAPKLLEEVDASYEDRINDEQIKIIREDRKKRRYAMEGDIYSGDSEVSYDEDVYEEDEDDLKNKKKKKKQQKRVLGVGKRSDETDEQYNKRIEQERKDNMKRLGLSDVKGENETDEEYKQRIQKERNDAIQLLGQKREDESQKEYDARIKAQIEKYRKDLWYKQNPWIKRPGENAFEHQKRRMREKRILVERNGLSEKKGELETEPDFKKRIDREKKESIKTIGPKPKQQDQIEYDNQIKEQIEKQRKNEWIRRRRCGVAIREWENENEYKSRVYMAKRIAMGRIPIRTKNEPENEYEDRLEQEQIVMMRE